MNRLNFRALILALIILLQGWGGLLFAQRSDEYYKKVRDNLELFRDIYREVSTRYVDNIDPEEFLRAGIRGMLETLDPYTVFIDEAETENMEILTSGQYGGIGTVIGLQGENKVLTVISPMEGTPAERLGIRAGDQILEIDSVSTTGFDTEKAAKMMRGEPGTQVRLKILRPGFEEPIEFTVIREIINVKDVSVATMMEENIGYVRLSRFSRKAGEELKSALEKLDTLGMKALVLDLRGNPGGLLEAAVEVTEKFVPKDEIIVSTKGMVQEVDRVIKARGEPVCEYCPLVVLVDGGSASAAEIVAGAIQDLDRGVIVGERTFGKGLVQSLVSFKNGTELKLTTAKYFTPSGRLIQKTDYFGDENPVILQDASVKEGEDQAVKYFTKNGREVFGGGGITPDIEVKYDETSKLEAGLLGGSFFFSFANEYMSKASAETALNDTLLFSKFKSYLQQKNFNYKVEGQSELEALRKIVEAKGVGTEFQKSLDELAQALEAGKKRELEENRGKLERYLRQEFGFRSSGSEGRLKVSASGDEQLQKAILTLKNTSAYQSILSNSSTAGK